MKNKMKTSCPVCSKQMEMIQSNVFHCKSCETEFYMKLENENNKNKI